MTVFGIVEGLHQTVVVNPLVLRCLIPQVERGIPVCYLVWAPGDHVKVQGSLNEVLGKLGIQSTRLTSAEEGGSLLQKAHRIVHAQTQAP